MPRCGRHGWLRLAGLGLALAGCSATPPPTYPNWTSQQQPFAPSPSSGNAYDGYVLAAREAEQSAGNLSGYVSFEGKHKRMLIERIAPALKKAREASQLPCDVRFVSRPPLESNPDHAGWRLIRYSLVWQIQAALTKGDFDTAVDLTSLTTKIGFDLAGGGAAEADLGLQFVDDARRAIAPRLPDLSIAQLARLTAGLKRGLAAMPSFETIAQNEEENYLQGVQWIQTLYREDRLAEADNNLGNQVRDATTFLKQLKKDDRTKRPPYFEGFAKEAEQFANWYRSQAALPTVKRKKEADMPKEAVRPWRRFSASLFTTLRPILARYDSTLARTRLMVLTCEIQRQIKIARAAPKSLGAFSSDLTVDPYSGGPFKYRATGMEFYLYSVGLNFQDDQGSTDSIFTAPDLTLETTRR